MTISPGYRETNFVSWSWMQASLYHYSSLDVVYNKFRQSLPQSISWFVDPASWIPDSVPIVVSNHDILPLSWDAGANRSQALVKSEMDLIGEYVLDWVALYRVLKLNRSRARS